MQYSELYISINAVIPRVALDLSGVPCHTCRATKKYGWQYDDKRNRLYCSKDCAYKDTGEYFASKQVTALSKPRMAFGQRREYDQQMIITRKIRLEADELLDDIINT